MRDKTHMDFVERWAKFVKENPDKWKEIHTRFVDDQLLKSKKFYDQLKQTEEGREKIKKIFKITNKNFKF